MPNQNTSFACQYDPNNDQLNILLSNNLENQNENDRKILVDAVGYIIGVMNNIISEIAPSGNNSQIFNNTRSFILEFGFDYAVNLRQAREQYGEQGYRDELTAIARSSASFIVGFAGSEAGKLAGAFISNTPAGRIGGAVIAGVAASVVYDYYLSSSVDAFFDGIIGSPIRNVNQTNPSNNLISVQTQLENGTFQSKAFNIKNATINNYPSLNYQDIFYDIEDDTNHNVITTYLSIEGGRNLIIGYDNPNNSYNDGFSSGFRSIISYAASQESIHADLLSNTITTGTELAQDGALANQDILVNINNVYGGYGDDFMLGNLHSNELHGNDGNDEIDGDRGNDILIGGQGSDTIDGHDDNDYIEGNAGSDILDGGDGNDIILGEEKNTEFGYDNHDTIIGGKGDDYMVGGDGNDIYVYNVGDGKDIIFETEKLYSDDDGYHSTSGDLDENSPRRGDDKIKFGEGISIANLLFSTAGKDLVIKFTNNPNDQIIIKSFVDIENKIEQIEFFDGTTFNLNDGSLLNFGYEGSIVDDTMDGSDFIDNISGDGGSDIIYGYNGDDIIDGGDNNDEIYGGYGDDIIIGGRGDDYLGGNVGRYLINSGNDIYIYNVGDGKDTIEEAGSDATSKDKIIFGEGIIKENLLFSTNESGDLIINFIGNDEDQITIKYQLPDFSQNPKYYRISTLEFFDHTLINLEDANSISVLRNGDASNDIINGYAYSETIYGVDGNGEIYGADGNDIIIGGKGDDLLVGGNGNDAYIYNLGDGKDVIDEQNSTSLNNDKIIFGDGINKQDLVFSRDNQDLIINFQGNVDDQITIKNFLEISNNQIETIQFSNGSTIDLNFSDSILINSQNGTGANDIINGSDYADIINAGDGDDQINGGFGSDIIEGGQGDDCLIGGNDYKSIYQLNGNVYEIIGQEVYSDTYIYNIGDGRDAIEENLYHQQGNNDKIIFGAGINAQSLIFSASGNNLVIDFQNNPDDQIILKDHFLNNSSVEILQFFDGSTIDVSDIEVPRNIIGSDGDDYLQGGSFADTIQGLQGNDYMSGLDGSDTYIYNLGDGNDTIYEQDYQNNKIVFGEAISKEDIILSSDDGYRLLINFAGNVGQINIDGHFSDIGVGIKTLEFSDGRTIDLTDVDAFTITQNGTDEDEYFDNTFYDNIINAGDGNDEVGIYNSGDTQIATGNGKDIIFVGKVAGQTTIISDFSLNDKINLFDFSIDNITNISSQQGNDAIIDLGDEQKIILQNFNISNLTNDQFELSINGDDNDNMIVGNQGNNLIDAGNGNNQIITFDGDDNIIAGSGDDIINVGSGYNYIISGAGNDIIISGAGGDEIEAGEGNDTINSGGGYDYISGGAGNDTFIISPNNSNGTTTITDFEYTNQNEKIDLSAFTQIRGMEDITITEGSAIIHLTNQDGSEQTIHILNATPSDITADNFIFAEAEVVNQAPKITNNNTQTIFTSKQNVNLDTITQNQSAVPIIESPDGQTVMPETLALNKITAAVEVQGAKVIFKNSVAGFNSSLGWYKIDELGNISSPKLLFSGAKSIAAGTQFDLGAIEAGAKIGFFIIANGNNVNWQSVNQSSTIAAKNTDFINNGTFSFVDNETGQDANIYNSNSPILTWHNDIDGQDYNVARQGSHNGAIYHSINQTNLNADNITHSGAGWDMETNNLLIGFEDLNGGGDRDYNDMLFYLDMGDNNENIHYANNPNLNITINDDGNEGNGIISQAVIELDQHIENNSPRAGDNLVFENSNKYHINQETGTITLKDGDSDDSNNIDTGIAISIANNNQTISLSGNSASQTYQEIINLIKFVHINQDNAQQTANNNSSITTNINISITDDNNQTTNLTQQIEITNQPAQIITGTDNDDTLIANSNYINILTGGQGNDIFNFDSFQDSTINQTDIITDFTQGEDAINLSGLNYTNHIITFDENPNDNTTPEGLSYHFDNDNNTIIEDQSQDFSIKLIGHINLGEGDFGF